MGELLCPFKRDTNVVLLALPLMFLRHGGCLLKGGRELKVAIVVGM